MRTRRTSRIGLALAVLIIVFGFGFPLLLPYEGGLFIGRVVKPMDAIFSIFDNPDRAHGGFGDLHPVRWLAEWIGLVLASEVLAWRTAVRLAGRRPDDSE